MPGGWVYIVCNKPHGVIYVGVTADLVRRINQHRDGSGSAFARRHHCTRLVYAEPHSTIDDAIRRGKAIKAWLRLWKLRLIQQHDPSWEDLFPKIDAIDG
jgi:putative endonuclease